MTDPRLVAINELGRRRLNGEPLLTADAFEESKHPRADNGQFGAGATAKTASSAADKKSSEATKSESKSDHTSAALHHEVARLAHVKAQQAAPSEKQGREHAAEAARHAEAKDKHRSQAATAAAPKPKAPASPQSKEMAHSSHPLPDQSGHKVGYDNNTGNTAYVTRNPDGSYSGDNGKFDFHEPDAESMRSKLKRWGYNTRIY